MALPACGRAAGVTFAPLEGVGQPLSATTTSERFAGRLDRAGRGTAETPRPRPRGRAVGDASLRLRSLALSAEGRDRRLPVSFCHLDVPSGVIGQVWIVLPVPAAQCNRRKLGAPHIRLQLLKG